MGVGKTTIGRRLAPRLNIPFFDADAEIEKAAGTSISTIFEEHGEAHFREGEAKVIARLLEGPPHVLATGGGALTTDATFELVQQKSISIWLHADIGVVHKRATQRNTRPLLAKGDARATLENLLAARVDRYKAANLDIESVHGPHGNVVERIIGALAEYISHTDKLPQQGSTQ